MLSEAIAFQNKEITLRGTLSLPSSGGPHPALVVAHTSHAGARDFGVYQHLAQVLPGHGVAVFIFDRRGSGESGGDFKTASFHDLAADVQAALDQLKLRPDMDAGRLGVWGMSQGGWIAPLAASESADVAFVSAVSASGVSPAQQMNYSAEFALRENGFSEEVIAKMLALRALVDDAYRGTADPQVVQEELDSYKGEAWYPLAYLDKTLPESPAETKWALEMDFDPSPMMRKVTVPVLLLYSEIDPWIPVAESIERWVESGPQGITVRKIGDANHFMISIEQAGIVADSGKIVAAYTDALTEWIVRQVM